MKINAPSVSKINWTSLVLAVIGIAVGFGYIPPGLEDHIITILSTVMALGGMLIAIFRTWFTEKN